MNSLFKNQRTARPPGRGPGRPRTAPKPESVGVALAATHRQLLALMEHFGSRVGASYVERLARNRLVMRELPAGLFAEQVEEYESRMRRGAV